MTVISCSQYRKNINITTVAVKPLLLFLLTLLSTGCASPDLYMPASLTADEAAAVTRVRLERDVLIDGERMKHHSVYDHCTVFLPPGEHTFATAWRVPEQYGQVTRPDPVTGAQWVTWGVVAGEQYFWVSRTITLKLGDKMSWIEIWGQDNDAPHPPPNAGPGTGPVKITGKEAIHSIRNPLSNYPPPVPPAGLKLRPDDPDN